MTDIKELLPHRDPFLFVDELVSVSGEKIVAKRKFKETEFFFKGHFPSYPVVPGVILVETMAQAGGAGVKELGILGDSLFFLASVDKVKVRKQVKPGDEVTIEVTNLKLSAKAIKQSGRILLGGECACEAEWLCLCGGN